MGLRDDDVVVGKTVGEVIKRQLDPLFLVLLIIDLVGDEVDQQGERPVDRPGQPCSERGASVLHGFWLDLRIRGPLPRLEAQIGKRVPVAPAGLAAGLAGFLARGGGRLDGFVGFGLLVVVNGIVVAGVVVSAAAARLLHDAADLFVCGVGDVAPDGGGDDRADHKADDPQHSQVLDRCLARTRTYVTAYPVAAVHLSPRRGSLASPGAGTPTGDRTVTTAPGPLAGSKGLDQDPNLQVGVSGRGAVGDRPVSPRSVPPPRAPAPSVPPRLPPPR